MYRSHQLFRTVQQRLSSTPHPKIYTPFAGALHNFDHRSFCSDQNSRSQGGKDGEEAENQSNQLFDSENIKGISASEVARLRVTYGLVKEHAEAIKQGIDEIDPERNPLIDPRSFDVRRMPELPDEILKQFRKDYPSDVASESRPISTQGIWEAIADGNSPENVSEVQNVHGKEWAAVDSKTMDARDFSRMQRLSFENLGTDSQTGGRMDGLGQVRWQTKRRCPLKDRRGKVNVDFREVGLLSQFLTPGLKIMPRKRSGLSAKAQRKVAKAVKTARQMALLNPEPKPKLTVEEMLEIEKNLP